MNRARRVLPYAVTALFVLALAVYFVILGSIAVRLISDGTTVSIGLGAGLLALPIVGAWSVLATLKAGFEHQRLAAQIRMDGRDVAIDRLPKRASGRVQREAADLYFAQLKGEWEAAPDDWRTNFRIARAYDLAGDRRRARMMMRRAVQLERARSA